MTGDQQGRLVGSGSMFCVYQKDCVLQPHNRHGSVRVPEGQVSPCCQSLPACDGHPDAGGFTAEVTPGARKKEQDE